MFADINASCYINEYNIRYNTQVRLCMEKESMTLRGKDSYGY